MENKMLSKCILSIDIGTSSVRAALFDGDGKARFVSQKGNPPRYMQNGRVEQDASTWKDAIFLTLSECKTASDNMGFEPEAISLTSQRSSVLAVDREGEPLCPAIMWQDTRTDSMCAELTVENQTVYRKSGLRISPVPSAIKMKWLKVHAPEIYTRSYKLLGIQDYAIHILSGNFMTDRSLASRTNLLNLETLDWDEELLSIFQVDRAKLCDLVDQGALCGTLSKAAAASIGLPEGLPLVSAGGDQQCAALGLGLYKSDRIVANTGTGSYVISQSPAPILDPAMRVVCNVAAVRGAYIIEAATLTSGRVYRWFFDNFYNGQKNYDEINSDVDKSPAGSNGVILIPNFKGSGAPYWNPESRGLFFNLSLSTTKADMARSILEGIASEMTDNIQLLESLSSPVETIRIAGGLCRFGTFNQIQADMYAKTTILPYETEATSLGAWISAAVCLGLKDDYESAYRSSQSESDELRFEPNLSNKAVYDGIRKRKRAVYEALYLTKIHNS
jgi:sugar (pentulose or hexulose) kinase